ncbi:MAG: FAD:protein FMN transferase [Gemmatimonadales bacterium]
MATRFELVAHGTEPALLLAAAEAALEVVDELAVRLSRFDPSGLLAHLRRVAPRKVAVDAATLSLFEDALAIAAWTDGRFDVTGGVGGLLVHSEEGAISLESAATELDLGAIAKGHALDLAVAELRAAGVAGAFVHGGTSSGIALGSAVDGRPWRVALEGKLPAPVFELADLAYSVSATHRVREGAAERHLRGRDGEPVAATRTVAIVGPSGRVADAWATAVAAGAPRRLPAGPGWRGWIRDDDATWQPMPESPT